MADILVADFPAGCAIVFGGSGGIGRGIVEVLAARGANVAFTYHASSAKAAEIHSSLEARGSKAISVKCDVTDRSAVDAVFEAAIAAHGRVHSVISATGLLFDVLPVADLAPDRFQAMMDTDVKGLLNIAQAAVPHMRAAGGGSITALITTAVGRTLPADTLSAVPKAAVAMLIRQIASEEGVHNIRANAVGPGPIDAGVFTKLVEGGGDGLGKEICDGSIALTSLKRLGSAYEVGEVITFLASQRASFVTGQVFYCDGGMTA